MYYCGIDYHKKYSVVSIIDSNGQPVDQRQIPHVAGVSLSFNLFFRFAAPQMRGLSRRCIG